MPDGEFEYVKPPHFYIDKEAEEDTIPAPKIKSDKIVSTSNPLMDGNMNNNEDQNEINETLHTFDDSPAFDPEGEVRISPMYSIIPTKPSAIVEICKLPPGQNNVF